MANKRTDIYSGHIECLMPSGYHEQVDGNAASATSVDTFYAGQVVRVFPFNNIAYMKIGDGIASMSDIPFSGDKAENINIKEDTKLSFYGAIVDLTVML